MKTDYEPTSAESTEASHRPSATGPSARRSLFARVVVSIVLILFLAGGGIALFFLLLHMKPAAQRVADEVLPPLVEVRTLKPRPMRQVFVGYGSARSDRSVTVAAEVAGQIVEIPPGVNDGAHMAQGEVLARIDDRRYRREMDKALAELADVKAQLDRLDVEQRNIQRLIDIARNEVAVNKGEYDRLSALYERNAASKKEWDFARLAYERSNRELRTLENERDLIPVRKTRFGALRDARQADVEMARLDVERCTIVAPFEGQIQELMVEAGDRVQPGVVVCRFVGTRFIEVPVELPLSVRPLVQLDRPCVLSMDSLPGVRWRADVRRLSPVADAASRTFTAFLDVDNAKQATPLIPGSFLTAHVDGPVIPDALAIPRGAIVRDEVFVVNGNEARLRRVHVDALIGDRAVVSGEVHAGDRIILTNLDVLSEGAPIRWRESDADGIAPLPEVRAVSGAP
ncbi:MAG: efflux RND transporter periplasmic adaptor subunit [Phycisphaerae bacterium]